jgi:hypothetical protein
MSNHPIYSVALMLSVTLYWVTKKMPSDDSKHIIPLLNTFKSNDGSPIALVHDMGNAILKAVKSVFPTVPDYICHFHFLRDIGKDLFEGEYRTKNNNI